MQSKNPMHIIQPEMAPRDLHSWQPRIQFHFHLHTSDTAFHMKLAISNASVIIISELPQYFAFESRRCRLENENGFCSFSILSFIFDQVSGIFQIEHYVEQNSWALTVGESWTTILSIGSQRAIKQADIILFTSKQERYLHAFSTIKT